MPSIWSRSRDHPLSSSLKRTNTHIHTLFLKQNHIVCLNPAWAFFPTLLLKYPVEHTRTADQMGRSSCRWEKRECGVRWREWGPRDCCLHQKDGQCICFKQTCVNTLTHAQPYAIFFFEVDVSLNRGHQSRGLVVFHAYRATKPHPGVLVPWNWAGCLKEARVVAFAARKQRDLLALKDWTPPPEL